MSSEHLTEIVDALPAAAIGSAVMFAPAAAYALLRRDNSIADLAWGPAIFAAAVCGAGAIEELGPRTFLALGMIAAWALRLALHIGPRRRHAAGEDWRYARWREQWGGHHVALRSLLQVFALQGVLAVLVASCALVIAAAPDQQVGPLALVGAMVWAIGLAIEAVADLQLQRFLERKRAGRASGFCDVGLWRRSRHPNYFGEAITWWGVALVALGAGLGWWALLALVSPILVTVLVRYVSGVPILERAWRERPGFDAWAARVPIFVPGLPAKPTHDREVR
jgi:steroid 5-alpha reductase family enzyme